MSAAAVDSIVNAFAQNALVRNSSEFNIVNRLLSLRQFVQDNGCNVNTCFVLQGDETITPIEFQNQINFLDVVANIISTDENAGLCAIQYGRFRTTISKLTNNREEFFNNLDEATQVGGRRGSFLPALSSAIIELVRHRNDANKIVLFTDIFNSFGLSDRFFAERFRFANIQLCAVSVGESPSSQLQRLVGSSGNLLTVDDFFELLEIISALVTEICTV